MLVISNRSLLFSVSDQSKSLVIEYVGMGYWNPLPLASPSIIVSMNALLIISISSLQSLYLKSISLPPTRAGSSARSAGTVQSSVMLEKGACVPQRLGVLTPYTNDSMHFLTSL